ncbi:hypothetical protein NXW89_13895 [Bacteroides thetaiotaomicron]|nr:hypothetical protein [Bacteroides thetaiotaomicron]
MKKNDMDIILSRIERLSVFIEGNTLEGFQREILRVENYLQRFAKLDELLAHLKNVEKIAYAAKDFSEHRRSCSVSASIQELCL